MESTGTPVTQALEAAGVAYRFFRHPQPVRSLEQAATERGQRPEQVVRSILFRLAQGEYLMALVAGPGQISWPALRSYLGQSRLSMANHEEVLAATGYLPGAVSPFGLPRPLRVLVDHSVMRQEEISIGSGLPNTTVILTRSDLMKALGPVEIGDFTAKEN